MPLMGSGSQVFQVSLIGSLEQRQSSSVHSEIACMCGLPVPNTGKGRQNESLLFARGPRKTHATFDVLHACTAYAVLVHMLQLVESPPELELEVERYMSPTTSESPLRVVVHGG